MTRAQTGFFTLWLVLLGTAVGVLAQPIQTPVTFQVNDSMIKGKVLDGVGVAVVPAAGGDPVVKGVTGPAGTFQATLPPGAYQVYLRRPGYVTIAGTAFEVGNEPLVLTNTMTMMMESVGLVEKRRVQVVLNWGEQWNQPRDLDAHLACSSQGVPPHVYYSAKKHDGDGYSVELDVDDTDGGGPETITLLDPPPGTYTYWVHNYSSSAPNLGLATGRVRVIIGDVVAGEFTMPGSITSRVWLPFKGIAVDGALEAKVVPFASAEVDAGLPVKAPTEQNFGLEATRSLAPEEVAGFASLVVAVGLIVIVVLIRRRRARKAAVST
jgi:uncharacterized protein YfaP (DUF2135 family)